MQGQNTGRLPNILTIKFSIKWENNKTLHGGVASTMATVRSLFWIAVLRKLTKSVIRTCYGSEQRIIQILDQGLYREIELTIWDGRYRLCRPIDLKAYILLFSCKASRAVYLEIVANLSTNQFIKSFKKLTSRRGKSNIIYSDNVITFKAGAKWLNSINRDEKFRDFWVKKRFSGNSTFQGRHGGEDSTNV